MYKFKQYREARGFSQKFVALSLGVKAPSISDWEKGKTNPTIENLIALSKILGVSCDELLGLRENALDVVSQNDNVFSLSNDEKDLILVLRSMNHEARGRVLWFINTLADSPTTQDGLSRKTETS